MHWLKGGCGCGGSVRGVEGASPRAAQLVQSSFLEEIVMESVALVLCFTGQCLSLLCSSSPGLEELPAGHQRDRLPGGLCGSLAAYGIQS